MTPNAWLSLAAYVLLGLLCYLMARRRPLRYAFSRDMVYLMWSPHYCWIFFPITGLLSLLAWPVFYIGDFAVYLLRLDTCLPRATAEQDATPDVRVGVCRTALKPGGIIEIDGERLDATCGTGFLAEGTRVRVVGKQGFNLVDEPDHEES